MTQYPVDEEKWQAIHDAVRQALETAEKSARRRAELPFDVLFDLEHALKMGLEGRPLPIMKERHPEDKRPRHLTAISPRDMVAIHMLGVEMGLIDDPAPNKTAATYYARAIGRKQVTRQTIQQIVKQARTTPSAYVSTEIELMKRHPSAAAMLDLRRINVRK